ncbi:MAG: hypothetical protein J7502_04815, partial [Flavisolibacter sp.]|nr:hypothetical protein [Flavisolibacter sp.]
MKKFLRTIPIHSFLIGLYVILFIYIRNTNKTSFSSVYRSILVELAVTVLVFAISYLLLRSARKAGIFSTLLLVGLFIYGILYNKLEALYYNGYWPFSHIHRFLLIFYFLIYVLLFVFFFRSKRPHYNLNYILNSFVLILFLMNLPLFFLSLKNETTTTQSNKFLAINSPGYKNIVNADNSFPDVYYIILDGYANEKILKDFYLDKSPLLYQYLRKRGFYIADSSRANYPFTALSLSSSLNLGYLDSSISNTAPTTLIRDNTVNHIFKKANYKLINIESGFAITEQFTLVDKTISAHLLNEFETRLVDLTILRLDDVLGFTHYKRLKNVLNGLESFLQEKGPKFCFIHIVSPHPPYVVDSAGKRMV